MLSLKKGHHEKRQERDELVREIMAIKRRARIYPPIQSVVNEWVRLKDRLSKLQ